MSTTLPLFWHLSSASKKERIEASVKLVGALEHFQAQFVPREKEPSVTSDDEDEEAHGTKPDTLDALNAQDVSYSIRRLVRGLASPRESSRLGFSVALTELLSRLDTVTASQIVAMILDSSKTQGSTTGQEERDMLFARLFGLTAVIQSGLLVRDAPLRTSASSSTLASSLATYVDVIEQLISLGEKKSWLRESAWWTIGLAVDALSQSQVSWKDEAVEATIKATITDSKVWTPEKIALALKLQNLYPSRDWRKLLSPTFKNADLLSTANLSTLAKILKEASGDDDDESDLPKSANGSWKPQVHFVWDLLLDQVLAAPSAERASKGSFPEFFRIVVDESLFAASSSPERKYWGFQIFQKALSRVGEADLPMLFTKNFMRSWINHLSNTDRYLHKAARQVVADIQAVVKKNPTIGFTLILQLTGVNGSRQFDKLTKTKTVESVLTSMDDAGIQNYIEYLLKQVDEEDVAETTDIQAINARRMWIIDQLAALIRNGAIPKSDDWVQSILDWFVVHGIFIVNKKSSKSPIRAVHTVPKPAFSDSLRKNCRERLLSCLAELTGQSAVVKGDNKSVKVAAVASDGQFWVSRVLATIETLEQDTKHVSLLADVDEEEQGVRQDARKLLQRLRGVEPERTEAAKGAELLLSATLLHRYCTDDEEADLEALQSCIDGASRMFPEKSAEKKKKRKSGSNADVGGEEAPEPVDVLVDNVIGFLEEATAYMRAVANQVFTLLSGSVQETTIDLILTQLERRNPAELAEDEDEDMDDVADGEGEEDNDDDDDDESAASSANEEVDDDDEEEEEEDLELRRKIEEALRVNGVEAATGESDEESDEDLMDDDQMLAIDEQLSAVFRARANEKKSGKDVNVQREATHFKNRVLDLLDIFLNKQPKSPLVVRVILPLVELITSTGPDEQQLADKATGILRSRVGKAKEVATDVDQELAAEVLKELHVRARKASSSDIVATLSQCSLYLCKALLQAGAEASVTESYKKSLIDFATRKSSRLNSGFLLDFVRRYVDAAWTMRDALLDVTGKSVNAYRQCQVFALIQTLLAQLSINNHSAEVLQFMPRLKQTLHDVIAGACGDESSSSLTHAQVKDLLKLGLMAIRQTKKAASTTEELSAIWTPALWEALAGKLAESPRLKSATGLQTMSKQMAQIINQPLANGAKSSKTSAPSKRKLDAVDEDVADTSANKTKRKKVKKPKA